MTTDNIKDIIDDARNLALDVRDAKMLRFGIERIAERLESVIKDGLYVTPKKAIDAVLANPPLEGFAKFLAVPALGIQFKRHKSANMTKLIATWRDDVNDHVYEISVLRDGDSPNCGWRALATNDGHNVFQLRTKNRSNCEKFALSAMKSYLKRGHRKTYRSIRKKVES